jgi:hypothetical protein
MPLVTSLCDARQEGHVLDGLGAMGVAQMQQRMVTAVPPVLLEWSGSVAKDMWFDCVISMLNNQCASTTVDKYLRDNAFVLAYDRKAQKK